MPEELAEFDPALEGLAARTVLALLPQQAQVLVRLSTDSRRDVLQHHVEHLAKRGVVSPEQSQGLTATVAGESPSVDSPTDKGGLGSPSVNDVLVAALQTEPATDSFVDDLWVGLVTAWGAVVGEGIGGPPGSVIGAMLAHEWAQEHPPSTWFA